VIRPNQGILRAIRISAFLAAWCYLQPDAYAQSFDCSKASTAVEHAICDDRPLGELDDELARELKAALAAVPERRQWVLTDQRRWLGYRDRRCRDKSPLDVCLGDLYRKRVAHLRASIAAGATICRKIAEGYRSEGGVLVREQPPQYVYGESFPYSDDPVSQLQEWARSQKPLFVISEEVMGALKNLAEETGTLGSLNKMPGMDLYAVTHEHGSAHCLTSEFFTVESGIARQMESPGVLDDSPGWSCGAARQFARIDGIPALVQSLSDDRSPSMSDTQVIVTWDEKLSSSSCVLTYSYAPRFGAATYYDAKNVCEGPHCDGLRAAAHELVESVQRNPIKTRERLRSRLTDSQRAEYDAAVEPAIRERGEASGEYLEDVTDFVPMRLPYVFGSKVYVVSLGHFKPYGYIFGDWSVIFDSISGGKLVQTATFAVGMEKGGLEDISISLE
jgi:uncharacterized protein YecT (DUF1311 family)